MRVRKLSFAAVIAFGVFAVTPALAAVTPTTVGKFVIEPPTLTAIGVEWKIAGDDNTNAAVEVSYRRKGETAWRKALPLLRLQHELVSGGLPRDGDGQHFNR